MSTERPSDRHSTGPRSVDLFAVQAQVSLDDYADEAAYAAKHRGLAERIAARRSRDAEGAHRRPALAVWPEMIGAPLGVLGHVERARGAATSAAALQKVGMKLLPHIGRAVLRGRTMDTNRTFLAATAARSWEAHFETFSAIARDFDLWVVAGSALLPRNRFGDDSAAFAPLEGRPSAEIFNTSLLFGPTGHCLGATRKVNLVPTQEDVLSLSPGSTSELAPVETAFGRLGTLICYDGFAVPHTATEPGFTRCAPVLDSLGTEVIAQPSANAWPWDSPWVFDDGAARLRSDQWRDEGLGAELGALTSVRHVVNPQLVGELFENRFSGPSVVLGRTPEGKVEVLASADSIDREEVVHAGVDLPAGSRV
jgi:predicted amidohydrolase